MLLIPIFAGLSTIGALSGGATGIAKTINDTAAAKRKLEEAKRHNQVMEQINLGMGLYLKFHKTGSGLRLHNTGKGLYLKPRGYGIKKKLRCKFTFTSIN